MALKVEQVRAVEQAQAVELVVDVDLVGHTLAAGIRMLSEAATDVAADSQRPTGKVLALTRQQLAPMQE